MSGVINDITSAPQTFSSWDNCMAKAYCKWPAIVGIVIASLIVLSLVWCIASCLCCGATLCASCVRCLTCFGCCGMCKTGSGDGGRKSRHRDDYSQMPPTPYNGYQPSPAQMSYNRTAPSNQFAQFDASSKNATVNEDSLPAMPTWASAASRRVEDNSEPPKTYNQDVEMGRMVPSSRPTRGAYSQLPNSNPHSPLSPVPGQAYFSGQQHPYQSDLSTQRLSQHETGQETGFQAVPMSPAPTYTTYPQPHVVPGMAVTTDQFASHAPTPHEYSRSQQEQFHDPQYDYHPQQQQQQQYTYPPQQTGVIASRAQSPPESTRYVPTEYSEYRPNSMSPPPPHEYQHYQHNLERAESPPQLQPHQPQLSAPSARPPSLLQIGRKAVQGSQREI